MKVMTSYFYQIRNFTPNMIPLSTCVSDPKWYRGPVRKDGRGVIIGMRAEPFVPNSRCDGLCSGRPCPQSPDSCLFLHMYYNQLKHLDFQEIASRFYNLEEIIKRGENIAEELIMVLMLYETPNNMCSERIMIHKWFRENNYNIKEWRPPA